MHQSLSSELSLSLKYFKPIAAIPAGLLCILLPIESFDISLLHSSKKVTHFSHLRSTILSLLRTSLVQAQTLMDSFSFNNLPAASTSSLCWSRISGSITTPSSSSLVILYLRLSIRFKIIAHGAYSLLSVGFLRLE